MEATTVFDISILKGKVAAITGGGSGIGLEIALQLGLHGAKMVIMGRREDALKVAVEHFQSKGVDCCYFCGDVRSEQDANGIAQLAKSKYGKADILINAAAGNFLVSADDLSLNGFKTVLEIDTVGTFNMCRAFFPLLKESRGKIVNISAALHLPATWYQMPASAAKAAIDSMTRSLALEWGQYGITVNGIAPGPIAGTPGLVKLAPNVTQAQVEDLLEKTIPLKRLGTKNEMAAVALFLLSKAGDYITGHTVIADGGELLYKEPRIPREMVMKRSRGIEQESRRTGLASKL